MLIDEEGVFITGRGAPTLFLLKLDYNEAENCLEINSNNPGKPMEPLKMDLGTNSEKPLQLVKLA